ncbi:MAG: methylenetetrahydrofolate reductase C-terminal domain-containing protein [Candidatus Thermoplasmatota archaeon]
MIISKQKKFDYIVKQIENKPVFLLGCSECATICHTGGEDEVISMKKKLEEKDIKVTGWTILDPACHFLNDKRLLKKHKNQLNCSEKILVLACGNGVQTVSEILTDKDVIAGTDTLFLGEIKHFDEFERKCNLCGKCLTDMFGGICPITLCPKRMLNGPCGGSVDGKCEVNPDYPCVWDKIIKKLSEKKKSEVISEIVPPKDWSKSRIERRKAENL